MFNLGTLGLRTAAMFMQCAARFNRDKALISGTQKSIPLFQGAIRHCIDSLGYLTKNGRRTRKLAERLMNRELKLLDVPATLKPHLRLFNFKNVLVKGAYDPASHSLSVNLAYCLRNGRLDYFKLREICRHECKHVQQFMEIARAGFNQQIKNPEIRLPQSIAKIAESQFKIHNLDLIRVTQANSYKIPFTPGNSPTSYLLEVNARKLGYNSLDDFFSKAPQAKRVEFFGQVSQDLRPNGKYNKMLKHLDQIARTNRQKGFNEYWDHPFEIEARQHMRIGRPFKNLDITLNKLIERDLLDSILKLLPKNTKLH